MENADPDHGHWSRPVTANHPIYKLLRMVVTGPLYFDISNQTSRTLYLLPWVDGHNLKRCELFIFQDAELIQTILRMPIACLRA